MTNEETERRALLIKQMGLQWDKAYLPEDNDPRKDPTPGMITMIIPDKNKHPQVYRCTRDDVPEEALYLFKKKDKAEEGKKH